jgi:hypothetical protein
MKYVKHAETTIAKAIRNTVYNGDLSDVNVRVGGGDEDQSLKLSPVCPKCVQYF